MSAHTARALSRYGSSGRPVVAARGDMDARRWHAPSPAYISANDLEELPAHHASLVMLALHLRIEVINARVRDEDPRAPFRDGTIEMAALNPSRLLHIQELLNLVRVHAGQLNLRRCFGRLIFR
jgi:hypothetical protein